MDKISLSAALRKAGSTQNSIDENKIYFIDADEIQPHPDNEKFYKKIESENLKDLKESIVEMNGVLEPLIVVKGKDDVLYAISGNRRRAAVLELYNEGRLKSKQVPYKIKQFANNEDELKSIILLNSQRKKSILEEKNEIDFLYEFYKKEKDDNNLKGNTRKYIADKIGISETKLQRYLNISKLSDKLKEKLDNGEINFSVATEFMSLDTKTQDKLIDELLSRNELVIDSIRKVKKVVNQGKEINDIDSIFNDEKKVEELEKNEEKSEPKEEHDTVSDTIDDDENSKLETDNVEEISAECQEENITEAETMIYDDIASDYDDASDYDEDNLVDSISGEADKEIVIFNDEATVDNEEKNEAENFLKEDFEEFTEAEEYWRRIIEAHITALEKTLDDTIERLDNEDNIKSIIEYGEKLIKQCRYEKTGNNKVQS